MTSVTVFNNQGGGIFRLIDGPRSQPELEEFFETRQTLQAENTARDFGLRYFSTNSVESLLESLSEFYLDKGAAILEIHTENLINAEFFRTFKNNFETN